MKSRSSCLPENLSRRRRHQSLTGRLVIRLEMVGHLRHCDPFNPLMLVYMFDDPFMHQQNMWSPGNVGMNSHWKDELVVLSIEIVKMILRTLGTPQLDQCRSHLPNVLHVAWVYPPVAIRGFLDEHHGREVVKILL